LDRRQPYINSEWKFGDKATEIFCTTAYVNHRWPLLLGRDALTPAAEYFQFLHAALSSSAFPAAFPARHESGVFPGTGIETNLLCDGGMFDNLPFIPAIELLSETQQFRFKHSGNPKQFLRERLNAPDLIISGGFDPLPSENPKQTFNSRAEIKARSGALAAAVKTESFVFMSQRVATELQQTVDAADESKEHDVQILTKRTGTVVAGVVNIVPATDLHLNPTFGFSRSLGFDCERVAASIADGCFQTLRELQKQGWKETSEVRRSLEGLEINVHRRNLDGKGGGEHGSCACPYFKVSCAFAKAAEEHKHSKDKEEATQKTEDCRHIYQACCKDPVHQKLANVLPVHST
jgi:hypothetical protein